MRLSTSRPRWSVPSRCVAFGGWRTSAKLFKRGSYGAITGASAPTTTMSPSTTAAATPAGDWRAKRRSPFEKPPTSIGSISSGAPSGRAPSVAVSSAIGLLQPDPRVEPGVAQVDDEVHHDVDNAVDEDQVLDDHPVALADRLNERQAEPGEAECALGRRRAAEQRAELQPGERDDREQRVAQDVLVDDHPLAQPLGAGGARVVLVERLEDRRPRQPRDDGREAEAEREGRAEHHLEVPARIVLEVDDGQRRPPAEPHDTHEHDDQAEPVARDGLEERRDPTREPVEPRVAVGSAEDAERNADDP